MGASPAPRCHVFDGVPEYRHALSLAMLDGLTRPRGPEPCRVVGLGVGHQAEHEARGVADACDVPPALVRRDGVGQDLVAGAGGFRGWVDVPRHELPRLGPLVQKPPVVRDELALTMPDWHPDPLYPPGPDAGAALVELEGDPPVVVAPDVVEGERCGLCKGHLLIPGEEPHLDEDLESVAYPYDGFARCDERPHLIAEAEPQSVAHQPPAAQVVPEGEAARNCHDVVVGESRLAVDEPVDMDPVRRGPSHLEHGHGLRLAVDPEAG